MGDCKMKNSGIEYTFSAKVLYSEWYFTSLPRELAEEIRENHKAFEEGWGRLKVLAKIGSSEWNTAIWFDTKSQTYLMPIKAEIRKKEKIALDDEIKVNLWI